MEEELHRREVYNKGLLKNLIPNGGDIFNHTVWIDIRQTIYEKDFIY